MRLGIFVSMAGRKAGGPETYERGLVRAMTTLGDSHQYEIFCLEREAAASFNLQSEKARCHVMWPSARFVSMTTSLPLKLWRSGLDMLHATFVPPPFSPQKYVFTMHDTGMFVHPEFYHPRIRLRLNKLISRGISKARLIVCVSETSRAQVAEQFNISPDRLVAVYNGVSEQFRPVEESLSKPFLLEKYGLKDPYVLFVGQLKVRSKNILRLLESFSIFKNETRSDVRLVLAGRRPSHEPYSSTLIDETIARLNLSDHVTELGHVPDEDLPVLYSGAEMFMFPSLWEGFGLPVVEAMACGTPVVTSNVSCLPEVAGGAAVLTDPYCVEDMAGAMFRVFNDCRLKESLREKGLSRAKEFTWERTARQTLDAYKLATAM